MNNDNICYSINPNSYIEKCSFKCYFDGFTIISQFIILSLMIIFWALPMLCCEQTHHDTIEIVDNNILKKYEKSLFDFDSDNDD